MFTLFRKRNARLYPSMNINEVIVFEEKRKILKEINISFQVLVIPGKAFQSFFPSVPEKTVSPLGKKSTAICSWFPAGGLHVLSPKSAAILQLCKDTTAVGTPVNIIPKHYQPVPL